MTCAQTFCVRHWYISSSTSDDWSVEVMECRTFYDLCANFRADTEHWEATFNGNEMIRFHHRLVDCVHVKRSDRPQIDDLCANTLLGQQLCSAHTKSNADRM